jgi:hypothetical protein
MDSLQLKREVSELVIAKLSLSEDDIEILAKGNINQSFFDSLAKVIELGQIKDSLTDNKVLKLGLEDYIS